ncbi:piggyBac transposable element-derived protein 2-like [Calliphora vicina]|uniref:piggyBac transposable element-derived protein 2-like n=1 Tax=Calliphora vicina TaxID=7373 RepID=UPI00325B9F88
MSLTNAKILEILEESEDGLDFDDDSVADPEYSVDVEDSIFEDVAHDPEYTVDAQDAIIEDVAPDINDIIECVGNEAAESRQCQKKRYENILWKKKNLVLNEQQLIFKGNTTLPEEIKSLSTPIQYFFYFLSKEMLQYIADETNLYITQKDISDTFRVAQIDIQQFIGIVYMMSLVQLPNASSHWSNSIGTTKIREVMPLKKFEKIRRVIHFNDNTKNLAATDKNYDRMFKVRPVIDELNKNFRKVPLEPHLCVDEQMCSTKARNHLKRYIPNKPHKWGYKIYVLCGSSGFAYKIEPETGKENVIESNEPDLGASSNVVMRLARIIPRKQNFQLYFDNYFTSLPLLAYLAKEGIFSVGTIRRNRIQNCKLPPEKEMIKNNRGSSVEFVCSVEGIEIATVSWKDNKIVNLASTFIGEIPKRPVKRYDKAQKKYIEIERPSIVGQYNAHMGGVDLIDAIMGRYKIQLRSKRWQVRLFYHFLDLVMANSWLLYKKNSAANKTHKLLSSAEFRLQIAETLLKLDTKSKIKRTRSIEPDLQAKKSKGPAQHAPPQAVRLDQVGHWPVWAEKRIRCKMPNCQGVSQTLCEKCGVALCYNKNNNCFRAFHLS